MEYFIFVIIICFFFFLFSLYTLANDDFVLLRKHVTPEKVFNVAFLAGGFGLFCARLFYVLFNFAPGFLNPLVFSLLPYFPGLSFIGGILGISVFIFGYTRLYALPTGRFIDFFGISFLMVFPFGFLGYGILAPLPFGIVSIIIFLCTLLLGIILRFILQKAFLNDGSIGILSLLIFTFIVAIGDVLKIQSGEKLSITAEGITGTVIFFIFLVGLLYQEKEKILYKIKCIQPIRYVD